MKPRRRRRLFPRALTCLAAAIAATALGAGPPALSVAAPADTAVVSSAASPGSAPGSVFHLYGPQYMTRTKAVTHDQALGDAREFDVIAAKPAIYTPYLQEMRAANPSLVVVGYLNGAMAMPWEATHPADWYVRGANGAPVRSKYGNYMMDVRRPGWIRNRSDACRQLVQTSGYDGCILDIMGPGVVSGPYGPHGQVDQRPIDVRTGLGWTPYDWMQATMALADHLQRAVAPKLVYGNGIGDGARYFATDGSGTSALLTPTRSVIAEGFLRPGRAPADVVPDLATFRANIDMVTDAEARGVELLLTTKLWTSATPVEHAQIHEFSLGSYLLAAGGRTRWVFLDDASGDTVAFSPWWTAAARLGAPRGAYTVAPSGLYRRSFARGRVLVNPGTTTITQALDRAYVTLDGTAMRVVTLPPHSAKVLLVR